MNILRMHEAELAQLTGCKFAVLVVIKNRLITKMRERDGQRGRPFKYGIWPMLIITLMKLRLELAYRTLESMVGYDAVTISRHVLRICAMLNNMPLFQRAKHQYLIVDTTCSRIRSTKQKDYSGYKHHKNHKCQALVDDRRRIVSVSDADPGAVHDKTIWNKEFEITKHLLDCPTLGDKAYADGKGENTILFRPVKRNELLYKNDKAKTKAFNRELSKWRVTVEHVFAQLKNYRILRGIFPLNPARYGMVFRTIALLHNMNLDVA